MGGIGSGRRSGWPTVERSLTIDVNHLIRSGRLRLGQRTAGRLRWRVQGSGAEAGNVGFEADLSEKTDGRLTLSYRIQSVPVTCAIQLITTACNFGGRRLWFVCPVSGRCAVKLHLAPPGTLFAARAVYRLAYQSDRDPDMQRARNKICRLFEKLGGRYVLSGDSPPERPKGMHAATYARLLGQIEDAEDRHTDAMISDHGRLVGRLLRRV